MSIQPHLLIQSEVNFTYSPAEIVILLVGVQELIVPAVPLAAIVIVSPISVPPFTFAVIIASLSAESRITK